MPNDLARALAQLADPSVRRVLARAMATTIALLAALVALVIVVTDWFAATGVAWLDPILPWLSGAGAVVLAVLLLPLAAISVLGLFVDEVAAAVEARYYPTWPPARGTGIVEGGLETLRLLGLTAALNLLALPVYLLFPALNLVVYLALNGVLLGREYFFAVAQRRAPRDERRRLYRRHRGRIVLGGVALALLALVPLANLTLPVVGTAFMVHRYARLTRPE